MAVCAAELGNWAVAEEHAGLARALELDPDGDAVFEIAHLEAVLGWPASEPTPVRRPLTSSAQVPAEASATSVLARAAIALVLGDAAGAQAALDSMSSKGYQRVVTPDVYEGYLRASVMLTRGEHESATLVIRRATQRAREVGATALLLRLQIIWAVATLDGVALKQALDAAGQRSKLAILEAADAIVAGLELLGRIPDVVLTSARETPSRWRLAARARIAVVPNASSTHVAQLLEIVGSIDDVPLLRAFERTSGPNGRGVKFAQRLAERTSPLLEIFDLGETRLALGNRAFQASEMRRKSASLLMYLASRARQSVTREQVLDDLWPNLSPSAASNSLNQTLYFLRRAIDPWYEDGFSVDYLRNEAEVVGLSPALVRIASVEFQKLARDLLRDAESSIASALTVLDRYHGRFAPEFQYEEWSLDWRELVHGTYLDLVVATERRMIDGGDASGATAVARHALLVDPRNPDLHEGLVWTLAATGSRPAVSEQYAHFGALYREEYGVDPPALESIAAAPFLASRTAAPIRR